MPQHILVKHIAKRHSLEEAEVNIRPTPTLASISEIVRLKKQVNMLANEVATLVTDVLLLKGEFDYNKPQTCASCQQVHPAILMRYHAHTEHGV